MKPRAIENLYRNKLKLVIFEILVTIRKDKKKMYLKKHNKYCLFSAMLGVVDMTRTITQQNNRFKFEITICIHPNTKNK